MNSNEKIKLAIPTIDLLKCKRFKGGYFELYGGVIDEAICEADGPGDDYPDADDGWEPEYDFADPEEYLEYLDTENEDYADGIDRGYDATPESNPGTQQAVNYDESVPEDMKNQIDSLLKNLPEVIANQNVDITYNPELLALLNEKAAGAYLREGFTLPDGTRVEKDTILLGDNSNMSTVQEELIHCWQENNCIPDGLTPEDVLSAMEFQAAVYMDLMNLIESQTFPVRCEMGDFYSDFLTDCFKDGDGFTFDLEHFDFEYFIEHFREYYEHWLDYYENHHYGTGSDESYDWNWDELFN